LSCIYEHSFHVPLLCGEGPTRKRRGATLGSRALAIQRSSEDFGFLSKARESRYSSIARHNEAVRQETFGELNRRRSPRSLFETFDAGSAILSAQYDGLDMEDQLTCDAWTHHDELS
jgi:hypothetical protein